MKLTPVAATFTSSWPGPGTGRSIPVKSRTSGPPGCRATMACVMEFLLFRAGTSGTLPHLILGTVAVQAKSGGRSVAPGDRCHGAFEATPGSEPHLIEVPDDDPERRRQRGLREG